MVKPEPEFGKFPGTPARAPAPRGKFPTLVSDWRAHVVVSSRARPVHGNPTGAAASLNGEGKVMRLHNQAGLQEDIRALRLGQMRLTAGLGGADILAAADLADLAFLQGAAAGGRLHMLHLTPTTVSVTF